MKKNLIFLVLLACVSCGYHLEGRPTSFSPRWKTIYVPVWKNPTMDIRFGEIMAEALRERIELAGDLRLVNNVQEADLIFEGEIISVWVSGLAYNVYTQTLERRVSVRAKARLIERESGRIIWQNANIHRYQDYPVVKEVVGQEIDPGRDLALRQISEDLAEIIYHQLTSSF